MGERIWRGGTALVQDALSLTGLWQLTIPGGALIGEAVRQRLESRRQKAIALLIARIAEGEREGIVFGEDDADVLVDTLLRFRDAVEKGAATLNLDLLSLVIVGLKRNKCLEFDSFSKWANVLEGLSRPEILFLAASCRVYAATANNAFWSNLQEALKGVIDDELELDSLAAALTRTGLILPASGFGKLVYGPSSQIAELHDLAMRRWEQTSSKS